MKRRRRHILAASKREVAVLGAARGQWRHGRKSESVDRNLLFILSVSFFYFELQLRKRQSSPFFAGSPFQSRFFVICKCCAIKVNKNKVTFICRHKKQTLKDKRPCLQVLPLMWRNWRLRGSCATNKTGRPTKYSSKTSVVVGVSHFLVGDVNFAVKRFFGPPEKLGGGGYLF